MDTLRGLAKGRIWFWQTLPFFYTAFPELPSWKWPIFGYAQLLQGMSSHGGLFVVVASLYKLQCCPCYKSTSSQWHTRSWVTKGSF